MKDYIKDAKVLLTVKTYPSLSSKYDELVCQAGFLETGEFIRVYPIPFRKIDWENRYKKYQWLRLNLIKNSSDPRPESYRPEDYTAIEKLETIDTKGNWYLRKKYCLNKLYTNLNEIIQGAKDNTLSLAVFKPTEIIDFIAEPCDRKWDAEKLAKMKARYEQGDLFSGKKEDFQVVAKLPYKFKYIFKDDSGKESKMMIEDWETGALYWNMLEKYGNEETAKQKVKEKYYDEFVLKRDLHFYMGTTRQFHSWSSNPYVIIGTFTPKIDNQQTLF